MKPYLPELYACRIGGIVKNPRGKEDFRPGALPDFGLTSDAVFYRRVQGKETDGTAAGIIAGNPEHFHVQLADGGMADSGSDHLLDVNVRILHQAC